MNALTSVVKQISGVLFQKNRKPKKRNQPRRTERSGPRLKVSKGPVQCLCEPVTQAICRAAHQKACSQDAAKLEKRVGLEVLLVREETTNRCRQQGKDRKKGTEVCERVFGSQEGNEGDE
jgi:hypothetical protein